MTENTFSIKKELRKVAGKQLTDAFNVFLKNEGKMLCIDPKKETISLAECSDAPLGTYYFYQGDQLTKYWYNMNSNKPFFVISVKPLPTKKHILYLCLPPTSEKAEP